MNVEPAMAELHREIADLTKLAGFMQRSLETMNNRIEIVRDNLETLQRAYLKAHTVKTGEIQ
jgi:hypothetical protein